MFPNTNLEKIKSSDRKYKFLLDTSAYVAFELIYTEVGVFIPELLLESKFFDYFVTNNIIMELMNGPRNNNFLEYFKNKILNVEASFDRTMKHSLNVIEEDGKLSGINLYKISANDMGQIMLCQNYSDLILVANDQKLIKNATVVLKGNKRIKGVPNMIDLIVQNEPVSDRITILDEYIQHNRKPIGDFDLKNFRQYGK